MASETKARNVLVLWRWGEAEDSEGKRMVGSIGAHMRNLHAGDRIFVCATRNDELYILGAIQIKKRRGNHATGRNLTGPFQIVPLGDRKWRLRFSGDADRLRRTRSIAWQVRNHRYLTRASAELLMGVLTGSIQTPQVTRALFVREGKQMSRALSRRERDPRIRKAAIAHHGSDCMVCGFDFARTYGRWARDCVEVHHLHALGKRGTSGGRTSLDDVIVVCPNCHRALHRTDDASRWRALRRRISM